MVVVYLKHRRHEQDFLFDGCIVGKMHFVCLAKWGAGSQVWVICATAPDFQVAIVDQLVSDILPVALFDVEYSVSAAEAWKQKIGARLKEAHD